jgi:ATP-binding cassette subfamily B protein
MEQQARLTDAVLEYIQGISVIKSLHMSGDKAKKVKNEIEATCFHAIDFEEEMLFPSVLFQSCFGIGISTTIFIGSVLCLDSGVSAAEAIMVFIFAFQIYRPFIALGTQGAIVRVMEASLNRYEKVKEVELIDRDGRDIALDRFDIEFRDVGFSYGESETLTDVSFRIPERSMTALCGESGSGKTTIANLIVRFWDVQQGEVLVGGRNVKEMTCDSLLNNISMVFQKVYLFHDTVAANIRFGRPGATDEEVIEAAKKARCHDFITALPGGYDTVIGEGGSTLSGGERQRISIARAILKDSPIILLDEATASVDPENEKYIQQAIGELVRDKTLVVIAHRLSTIQGADQILVVDGGRIAERGTHDELLSKGGQYKKLWEHRIAARSWKIAPC